jgi:Zn ribbon nucleic-acid-binding protein
MEQLSEELFDAGWHDGLSTFLWADVLVGKRDHLWELTKLAGGWWIWHEQHDEPVLCPIDDWTKENGRISPVRCVQCNHYKAWPDGWWIPDVLTSKRPTIGALCPSCWKAEQDDKTDR